MGYMMGKNNELHVGCSDKASDFAYNLSEEIVRMLKKEEKEEDQYGCNTDGILNVAMTIQDCFTYDFVNSSQIESYAREFVGRFEKYIEKQEARSNDDWDGKKNKEDHLKAYNKILKNIKKLLGEENG